jgi:hypothetical protein
MCFSPGRPAGVVCAGIAVALSAGAARASVVNLAFTRITNNASQNVASQFNCAMSDFSATQVDFKFTNAVGIASSISEIYFDDGPFLQSAPGLTQFGCSFTGGGANPGNLPGGENLTPAFEATEVFSADAQGNPSLGIDTSADYLVMRFTLVSGQTFNDVLAALNSGALRIGLHVRAIGNGDSDSFVNSALVVPLPPAATTGLASLIGIGALRVVRRRGR